MKKLICLFMFALIVQPVPAFAGKINSSWFQCTANKDCTVVQTACNKWEGVNKKYAQSFAATVPKWSAGAQGCPSVGVMDLQKKNVRGQCFNNYCAAGLPKTKQ